MTIPIVLLIIASLVGGCAGVIWILGKAPWTGPYDEKRFCAGCCTQNLLRICRQCGSTDSYKEVGRIEKCYWTRPAAWVPRGKTYDEQLSAKNW